MAFDPNGSYIVLAKVVLLEEGPDGVCPFQLGRENVVIL